MPQPQSLCHSQPSIWRADGRWAAWCEPSRFWQAGPVLDAGPLQPCVEFPSPALDGIEPWSTVSGC